ncbi:MAG: APC family permease, partial [Planctomycetota bacterium]
MQDQGTQASSAGSDKKSSHKLKKELGLFDVYVISTGAMFSSGFFLLPGLATAYAGPSTVLAYLLAGILIIPAMLSMAELSTALPRAGGTYYFIDRSLGPMFGTIGGLGTWLALALKSGFALLGMGAYLAITPYVQDMMPGSETATLWTIKILAVVLTLVFMFVNLFGAKETTRLQGVLVITLLGVLVFFVVQGLWHVFAEVPREQFKQQYTPFLHPENGWTGLASTIGL